MFGAAAFIMRTTHWFSFVAASLLACSAVGDQELLSDDEHDGETEPAAESSADALTVAAVSCRERKETAYDNGRARPISVIMVGGKPVAKATGHAFLRMQRAAMDAGVKLSLVSGFRTQAEQQYLYNCYRTGACNNGNLAARPGYSNHQNGLALDLSTSAWLAANASRFGFVRTVPSENWHYEYRAGKDPGGPCSAGADGAASALTWESPKAEGWYKNGIWMKVRPKVKGVAYVKYFAGNFPLEESTDEEAGFPARYTFTQLGERTLTAEAYDIHGKKVAESSVDVTIVE